MAFKQMFFVQTFDVVGKKLVSLRTFECATADLAVQKAEYLSQHKCGVIAFCQAVDPDAGDTEEPTLLAHFGRIPLEAQMMVA